MLLNCVISGIPVALIMCQWMTAIGTNLCTYARQYILPDDDHTRVKVPTSTSISAPTIFRVSDSCFTLFEVPKLIWLWSIRTSVRIINIIHTRLEHSTEVRICRKGSGIELVKGYVDAEGEDGREVNREPGASCIWRI
jgi:hypothetical protein